MRPNFFLLIIIFLFSFVGCNNHTSTPDSSQSIIDVQPSLYEESVQVETDTDYSWFTMPEPSVELTVYTTDQLPALSPAIEMFQSTYPDVEVNLLLLEEDEFRQRIRAEIMSGKGPDLVYCDATETFPDLYKTMTTGIFTDLNLYFENDTEFQKDAFFEGVIEAGKLGNSQFIMPIECKVPILMTSEEALQAEGITAESLNTYEGFTEACLRWHENHPDNNLMTMGSTDYYLGQFFDTSAIGFIDYEKQTVDVPEDALHRLLDVCRAYFREKPNDQPAWRTLSDMMAGYGQYMGIVWRDFLFVNQFDKPLQIANNMALLRDEGETPVLVIAPDRYDGVTASVQHVAAIPSASQNPRNAYRFLTILLSDGIQSGQGTDEHGWFFSYLGVGIPVHRESVRNICDRDAERYGMEDIRGLADLYDRINRGSIRPAVLQKYIVEDLFPYVRGEKTWENCYKRFLNTLELYASE